MDERVARGVVSVLWDHAYNPWTPPGTESGWVWAGFGTSVVRLPSEPVLEWYEGGGCLALRTIGRIAAFSFGDSVGTLTVSGLSPDVGATIAIEPWCPSPDYICSYSAFAESTLFDSGATVTIAAPGEDFPGFSLSATAPAPLVLTSPSLADALAALDIGVVPELPFSVTWEPAGAVWTWVSLSSPDAPVVGTIDCFAYDTAELIIPAEATALLRDLEPVSTFQVMQYALAVSGDVHLGVGYREIIQLP